MRVRVPGDKSLTQRALIFAALADGTSRLSGLLHGGDAESTASALRALGVGIPHLPEDGGVMEVVGVGLRGLRTPQQVLDLGNSGTGTRLLTGVLAGSGLEAVITGDDSLRSRPMRRVTEPLEAMGARFEALEGEDRLPLKVCASHPVRSVDWSSRVASAQVKSAILLAGLTGGCWVQITEPRQSRDHTERMLGHFGIPLIEHAVEGGWRVELRDVPQRIAPFTFEVPGDPSSAAFLAALAALDTTGRPLTIERAGLNPTRTAFFDVLARMGAEVTMDPDPSENGEPVGSITVKGQGLRGTEVTADEVPAMIDELTLIALLGARAEGVTTIRGARELRTKESDRIDAVARGLEALGVEIEEFDDGLSVTGTDQPFQGRVRTHHDHRIAMGFGVLGATTSGVIDIDHPESASVSFPGFWSTLQKCAAR